IVTPVTCTLSLHDALPISVEWLLDRKHELPGMVVVVPTRQSGRRLREALAERAEALLAPRVVTPGWFLHQDLDEVAPEWMETLRSEEHTSELQSRENLVCR